MNGWNSGYLQAAYLLAMVSLWFVSCATRNAALDNPIVETPPPFSTNGNEQAPQRWWTSFNLPELDQHINQALGDNFNLNAAVYRVVAARAVARREASDLFPQLNGVANYNSDFGPGENQNQLVFGLDAAYQVDLWGEIGSRVAANRLRADATCTDYQALMLTLTADIARTWFSLIEAHAQLELLEEQIEINRTGLELQESRFSLGLIRSPDVLRQRQLLESTREQSVVVQSRIKVLEHQLAVLLGTPPQTAEFNPGTKLPELPVRPSTGLPMELLHRRPDVRSFWLEFMAADRDLASAISSRYPRLNLTGSLLTVAQQPETLLRDWFLSLGGQLFAPIFNGGALRAEVDRTAAVKCQRFHEYSQAMLIAFQEVEDSLVQEEYQQKRIVHLKEQVKLASQSSNQLREQYLIQEAEYLDVLSALTAEQSLERQLLSAQLQLVLIRVSLYLAIAGDFDPTPQIAALPLEEPAIDADIDSADGDESDDESGNREDSD